MHCIRYTYVSTYIHTYIHTCMHAYMHTCIHAYMHTCIHTYIHVDWKRLYNAFSKSSQRLSPHFCLLHPIRAKERPSGNTILLAGKSPCFHPFHAFHCILFHVVSFHFETFLYSCIYPSIHVYSSIWCHFISFYFTSFHFTSLHFISFVCSFHSISMRLISFHVVIPSAHPSIHASMHPCIHSSIHSFIHKPILGKLSIDPCVHWSRTAAEAAAASPCQRKRCIKMVQQAPWPTWCLQSCPNSKGKSAASCTVPRGRDCSGNSVDPPVHGLDNKWCSFHERGTALFLLLVPQKEKWHRPDKVVLANLCRKLFWTYICNVRPKYHDLLQTVSTIALA